MIFNDMPKIFVGDSENFHNLIVELYNISESARREGILVLEDIIDSVFADLQNEEIRCFCRKMLCFITDGIEPKSLEELARSYIAQSNLDAEGILSLMVAADAFVIIASGWLSGKDLIEFLLFKLGYRNQKALYEKLLIDFHENYSLATFCEENLNQDEVCKKDVSKEELGLTELMEFSDEELCKLLDEFSIEEWALAMKTADNCVQSRVFKLLSKIQASTMKNLMQYSGPVKLKDIERVQRQIKEKIEQIKN